MNKFIKISLLLCLPIFLQAQLKLNNNGAIMKVSTGTDLRVDNGSIENKNAGQITNDGKIYLDATFDQTTAATYTGSATSWLWFEGAANQNATSDAPINIARLRVDNGNRLVLGNHVNVSTEVNLMLNGNIELGNFNLNVASGGTIANYDATHYIITNGMGYLQQEVGGANVFFPVGNSSYNPATLNNVGTVDNLQVRVFDQVLSEGTTGTVHTTNVVNRTWMISEETVGGSDVTMTLQWATADELAFDRTNSGVSHHLTGNTWDYAPVYGSAASVGSDWSQTRTGFTSFSPFLVNDQSADLPIELMSFTAIRKAAINVDLDWATASELNNKGFEVQRMLENETEFIAIGWIDGFGTTSEITHYEYNDDNAYTGVSYYRLRQVDFDGTESFSDVRAVSGSDLNVFSDVSIYPVPVRDELTVSFGELPKGVNSGQVRIVDMQGRVIYDASVALQSHQTLLIEDLVNWASGMYLLQIQLDNGSSMLEKFVKE